jgi:hypothetical protein
MTNQEIQFPANLILKPGNTNLSVKRVQEWLCFHNFRTSIDKEFGPSTEHQVNAFRHKVGLPANSEVDATLFNLLCDPMVKALKDVSVGAKSLRVLVLDLAKQHLRQHPVEIGGDNSGPWVRLYCMGNDGRDFLWCAGFATFIVEHAAKLLAAPMPVTRTLSCDTLAIRAQQAGRFVKGNGNQVPSGVQPGDLFLIRRTSTDWIHTGIVTEIEGDTFSTIEGNTNDEGSANGYEVCARNRTFSTRIDFIKIS